MSARPAIQVVPNQTDTTLRKRREWSRIRVTNRSQTKLTHSVNVTIEPQPRPDTTDATSEPAADATSETTEPPFDAIEPSSETADETTSGAYRTGERTGEQLNHLWQETKDFGRGLWSTLTEKEQ